MRSFTLDGVIPSAVKVTKDSDLFGDKERSYAVLETRVDVESLRSVRVQDETGGDDPGIARTDNSKISLEPNPRAQNLNTEVAREIKKSLLNRDGEFHHLNRGILLTAERVGYDNTKQQLTWTEDDPRIHGNLDGGHTLRIIDEVVGSKAWIDKENELLKSGRKCERQFVTLQIIHGVDNEELPVIAGARNTSVNVEDYALLNLSNEFAFIDKALGSTTGLREIVAFKQNEIRETGKRLDIVRVLQNLTVLDNVEFDDDQKQPYSAYWSRARTVNDFVAHRENYVRLEDLVADALALPDYIVLNYREWYEQGAGKTGSGKPRFGSTRECKSVKDSTPLHVLPIVRKGSPTEVDYQLRTDNLAMPILGALRTIVSKDFDENGNPKKAHWLEDPYDFLNIAGPALVDTLTSAIASQKNATVVLKDKGTWKNVHAQAKLIALELGLIVVGKKPTT